MKPTFVEVALMALFLTSLVGRAEDSSLEKAVKDFWTSSGQTASMKAILDLTPQSEELEKLLHKGRTYSQDVPKGWSICKSRTRDKAGVEKEHPYHVLVPENYDAEKKYPLIFHMHGGVGRSKYIPEESFKDYRKQFWAEDARKGEFILAFPLGKKGSEWWTPAGLENVLGMLADLKKTYNIDENKIFPTGFSDGASGTFFLSYVWTTPFAGFFPLNGFPPVASVGGVSIHLPNASNKPLHVVNTTDDALYPSARVTPIIDAMKEAGATVTYKIYPDIGHRPDYLPQEHDAILKFTQDTVRVALPKSLTWETTDPRFGRCHWVTIDEIKDVKDNAKELLVDFNPEMKGRGMKLGVQPDRSFRASGVRVSQVLPQTVAAEMGLKKGDVITALDGVTIANLKELVKTLQGMKGGQKVSLKIKRGDAEEELTGSFPKSNAKARLAFPRNGVAGRVSVVAEGNIVRVRVRNVSRYTLLISRSLFDVTKPIQVFTNGKLSFEGLIKPDMAWMLEQAARDQDRSLIFTGRIEISVGNQVK